VKFQYIVSFTFVSLFIFTGCVNDEVREEEKKIISKPIKKENTVQKPTISVHEKKQNFKNILVPIAVDVYNELELQYQTIKTDIKMKTNQEKIEKLKKVYNAKTDELLLQSLKPHPISILLAQAAAESAWLTSRFSKEANNIFGVWSFNKKEPRIAASGLRGDKTIYLKKYKTLKDAVRDYYKNLGKNWAYKEFRKNRTLTSNPYVLSDYLGSYSEKKEVYTELLKSMIRYNNFEQYDIASDLEYNVKIQIPISNTNIVDVNSTSIESNTTIIKDLNITNKILPNIKLLDSNTTSLEHNVSVIKDLNVTNKIVSIDVNITLNDFNKTVILDNNKTNIQLDTGINN